MDVETELSKLDGLLEQVTKQEAEKVAAARSAAEKISITAEIMYNYVVGTKIV